MKEKHSKYRLLAVDDDELILHLVSRILKKEKIEVRTASAVEEAVNLLAKDYTPDLLLLDYNINEVFCPEMIENLKKMKMDIPFIVMTAHGDEKLAVEMMKLGARDYLIKDESFGDLMPSTVQKTLEQVSLEKRLREFERQLKESRKRYQDLFEYSAQAIYFASMDGVLIDHNDSFNRLFEIEPGYSKEMNIVSFYENPADRNKLIQQLSEKGRAGHFDVKLRTMKGNVLYCGVNASCHYDDHGNIIGYQGIINDTTDRKRHEDEIKKLNEKLEQHVVDRTKQLLRTLEELSHENEERKRAQKELTKAREEISEALEKEKELGKLKTSFISMVSHEFRTPLTVILSSSYLLERHFETGKKEQFESHLKKIRESVKNITSLIENALMIGKAESGKLGVEPQQFDLVRFAEEIINGFRKSDSGNHIVEFAHFSGSIPVTTDKKLLKQVLENLLINASNDSPDGSRLGLSIEEGETTDSLMLTVFDEGPGISDEDRRYLFEPFHRGRKTGTTSGSGLALAIVKRCVEVLGGKIDVQSEIDTGTKFFISLPKVFPSSEY